MFPQKKYQELVAEVIYQQNEGQLDEALLHHFSRLQSNPSDPYVYFFLGVANFYLGKYQRAIRRLSEALTLDSNCSLSYYFMSLAFEAQGLNIRALDLCDAAIAINDSNQNFWILKGRLQYKLKLFDQSLCSFNAAIKLDPSNSEANNGLGVVLRYLNRPSEAIEYCDRAIALKSNFSAAYYNRGNAHKDKKSLLLAHRDYQKAIDLAPNNTQALLGHGLLYLLEGEYSKGWGLYEWRYKTSEHSHKYRNFNEPRLSRDVSLQGKRVLVCSEQGLGDVIQFCRYIPMMIEAGAVVLLESPEALSSILLSLSPLLQIIQKGAELPAFDFYIQIASLPFVFGTLLDSIPAKKSYLSSSVDHLNIWKCKLGASNKFKVGLVWSGSATHDNDLNRSISLNTLRDLFMLPIEFHSLQVDYRSGDLDRLTAEFSVIDHSKDISTFADTAALIECLDLVIGVDTSVVHLAGALGKPVWIMLAFMPDFRWMLDRQDSPWYPTAKLFRQQAIGDWEPVINKLISDLKFHVA